MGFLSRALVTIGCILAILLVAKLFSLPFRLVRKLLWNSLIGFLMLSAFNLVAQLLLGFSLDITMLHTLVAGLFGIPGVVVLVIIALVF